MKNFLKDNWFKLSISVAIILIGISVAYYFVIFIPQREETKLEQQTQEKEKEQEKELLNKKLLEDCLSNADNSLKSSFIAICNDDKRISGGDNMTCSTGTIEDTINYMTASELYSSLFKRPLEKREKDRGECFKQYPIK